MSKPVYGSWYTTLGGEQWSTEVLDMENGTFVVECTNHQTQEKTEMTFDTLDSAKEYSDNWVRQ